MKKGTQTNGKGSTRMAYLIRTKRTGAHNMVDNEG